MEPREEQESHYVKRVVLPSGKTIEVVYFQNPAEHETSFRPVVEPDQDLHVCLGCGSGLVYPVDWEEAGPDSWQVQLRCPECEVHRDGLFSQEAIEAFDAELDSGTDALTVDYRRLCRANMGEEVERFIAALDADAVLPEDF